MISLAHPMLLKHSKASLFFALRLGRCLTGADQNVPLGFGKVRLTPMTEVCSALFTSKLTAAIVMGKQQ